jgi:hypothetical protein
MSLDLFTRVEEDRSVYHIHTFDYMVSLDSVVRFPSVFHDVDMIGRAVKLSILNHTTLYSGKIHEVIRIVMNPFRSLDKISPLRHVEIASFKLLKEDNRTEMLRDGLISYFLDFAKRGQTLNSGMFDIYLPDNYTDEQYRVYKRSLIDEFEQFHAFLYSLISGTTSGTKDFNERYSYVSGISIDYDEAKKEFLSEVSEVKKNGQ